MTFSEEVVAKAEAIDEAMEMVRNRYGLDGDKIEMIYDDLRELRDDWLAHVQEQTT